MLQFTHHNRETIRFLEEPLMRNSLLMLLSHLECRLEWGKALYRRFILSLTKVEIEIRLAHHPACPLLRR